MTARYAGSWLVTPTGRVRHLMPISGGWATMTDGATVRWHTYCRWEITTTDADAPSIVHAHADVLHLEPCRHCVRQLHRDVMHRAGVLATAVADLVDLDDGAAELAGSAVDLLQIVGRV